VANVEITFPGSIPALLQPAQRGPDPWGIDRLTFAVFEALVRDESLDLPFDRTRTPLLDARRIAGRFDEYQIRRPAMIREWERKYPGRIDNMLTAMGNVVPSHLMDRNLFPFSTIRADRHDGRPFPGGDIAFDDEPCAPTPTPAGEAGAADGQAVRWHRAAPGASDA
jgi:hypothetical protein